MEHLDRLRALAIRLVYLGIVSASLPYRFTALGNPRRLLGRVEFRPPAEHRGRQYARAANRRLSSSRSGLRHG